VAGNSCGNTAFGLTTDAVYIHSIWFDAWIGLLVKPYRFGLTMVVSLETIFLSISR
jgi:hypothetical protein